MGNKLYVGNLAYSIRDDELLQAFAQFGTVTSAKVMMDRETGRSKGFGFVEMGSDAEAQDLTQEFFARLLAKHWLNQADARLKEARKLGFSGAVGPAGARAESLDIVNAETLADLAEDLLSRTT